MLALDGWTLHNGCMIDQNRGKLYLVPVPIGNPRDISLRALDVLGSVKTILAEDTRETVKLLSKYQVRTPLISYHQHNEKSRLAQIKAMLDQGQDLALVSDAGMPCISDPGEVLVADLVRAGDYQIVALPGATAGLTCLVASGLRTAHYSFVGFLESKGSLRREQLNECVSLQHTFILYEAPHRLVKTLKDLVDLGMGQRLVCLGRELTKTYESYFRGSLSEALLHYTEQEEPRGEFVLVIEGQADFLARNPEESRKQLVVGLETIEADLVELLRGGMKLKPAAAYLADKRGLSKKQIYQIGLEILEKDQG